MDIQTLLLGEIQRQCNFTLIAFEELRRHLDSTDAWDSQKSDCFWYSIQSFLVSVANISKILWPSVNSKFYDPILREKISSHRQELRQFLGINNSSPIKLREARNYFEHYDAELEKWHQPSKDQMIFDSNICNFDPSILSSRKIISIRNFNPETLKLYFGNKEYDIQSIILIVKKIQEKIQRKP